ncbi:hypothetical protein LTR27_009726 [Elasticomyces elasticus]|nr:hypothetical protein LTR27_009726 [Elasticomyces elasticus]
MPRAAKITVSAAPNKTRWTLAQNRQDQEKQELVTNMQANAPYYDHHEQALPKYESFDGSQYSVPGLDRMSTASWKPPMAVNGNGNGHYDDHEYNTPIEERASHQISVDTRVPRSQERDIVGQHLLYETAMQDTQSFEILDIAEVDALKKEHARLNARVEAANRKLLLESKVKDAAQNLQRLYSVSGKSRPDTPQSPETPKKSRSSLMGRGSRTSSSGSGMGLPLDQAKDELAVSIKKVDELNTAVKALMDRRQFVESKLLRHTAAVLAEQSARVVAREVSSPYSNGHAETHGEDEASMMYSPDEFDGIRDILHGAPASSASKGAKSGDIQKMKDEHEQQIASVQSRLEHLNDQLRYVIGEASRTRGVNLEPEHDLSDEDAEPVQRLDQRLDRLEDNLQLLDQEQQGVKSHYARLQDSAHMTRNAVEEQLEGINNRLHNTLLLGADMQDMESMREPPQATGHGYQQQLEYLSDSLQTIEQLLRQHGVDLDNAREAGDDASKAAEEAHGRATSHAQKVGEYEATLGGLWDILQSDVVSRRPSMIGSDDGDDDTRSPGTPLREDFSLQAFNTRVQSLFDRAQSAKEQHDILRRQIQQQRELNGKSDAEKDRQLTDLQGKHEQLTADHDAAQDELVKALSQRAQVESEAGQSKLELMNVTNDHAELKRSVDAHLQERDDMQRRVDTHQSHATTLQEQIDSLEAQIADMTDDARLATVESNSKHDEHAARNDDLSAQLASAVAAKEAAEQRHVTLQKDAEEHENDIVRLTTELAMAKAELDGAYGSRAERAREAQAAEVAGLGDRNKQMTEELERLQSEHDNVRSLHRDLSGEHEVLRGEHEATLAQLGSLHAKIPADTAERSKLLEAELVDMTDAYQDLTREAIELEKERVQLEDLIDGLRDRCDSLEAQVNDERVRWLGMKSPSTSSESNGLNGRASMTSTMVLRQEFKKMMREARGEGVKALRTIVDISKLNSGVFGKPTARSQMVHLGQPTAAAKDTVLTRRQQVDWVKPTDHHLMTSIFLTGGDDVYD